MAIASLHNVSAFDSSFLGESQSPVSRQWGERERPRARASTLIQMWRELEGESMGSNAITRFVDRNGKLRSECVNSASVGTFELGGQGSGNGNNGVEDANVLEDEFGVNSQNLTVLESENRNVTSVNSGHSTDLGEIERQRVRQVFQGWMSNSVKIHSLNTSPVNGQSRAEWLGESECVKEWVQIGTNTSHRDEGCVDNSPQIEQVSDRLLVKSSGNGEWKGCRALRGLRGRQALLDLLLKAQRERKRELQSLMEGRPVSDFAYRNRIQSLLRGRFLHNDRLIWDERPASVAAREIGLLRQRQTVSYLREGFLSRLACNDPGHGHISDFQSNNSSNGEHNALENVHSQSDSGLEVVDDFHEQSELAYECRETNGSQRLGNSETVGDMNQHETVETSERSLEYEDYGQEETLCLQCNESTHNRELDASQNSGGLSDASESSLDDFAMEDRDSEGRLPKDHEAFDKYHDQNGESNDAHKMYGVEDGSEVNTINNFDWQGNAAQAEESVEWVIEQEETNWQQLFSLEFSERAECAREHTSESWLESAANQWYPTTPDNDVEEQNHVQGSNNEWHGDAIQESMDVPSTRNAVPVVDSFYIPDDNNVYSMELRELLSRRRVSNLLQSGFRERLDLLIQSYVERQGQASFDWEMDGTTSSPSAIDQDQQQENGYQDEGDINDIERFNFPLTSSPDSLSQPLWDQELQDSNMLCYNPHPRLGTEWEIINELRIDMDRLQQQMNNMQRMLETCMDMQIELQHSVQHEVFAALNRYAVPKDGNTCEDNLLKDEPKWDNVRKGICCLCCTRSIDSLLYRCGHMCTCSECAETLVQGHGKCPMCQAPVAEIIQAYFIQQ